MKTPYGEVQGRKGKGGPPLKGVRGQRVQKERPKATGQNSAQNLAWEHPSGMSVLTHVLHSGLVCVSRVMEVSSLAEPVAKGSSTPLPPRDRPEQSSVQGRVPSSFLGPWWPQPLCMHEGCLLRDLPQEGKENLTSTNESRTRKIPKVCPVILEVICCSAGQGVLLCGAPRRLATRDSEDFSHLGGWGEETLREGREATIDTVKPCFRGVGL